MANYFVSYDLNGPYPSHQQMDEHIQAISSQFGRVLETVWYVKYAGSASDLRDQLKSILGSEDRLLVVESKSAAWLNLLIDGDALNTAWEQAA